MNDPDYSLAWPNGAGDGLRERVWADEDFPPVGEYPVADVTGGLVSLKFIAAALRRRARIWCVTAAIGFLACCGFVLKSPPSFQAQASVLLTPGPYENVNTSQNDDQAMAQSRTVASMALRELGSSEDAGKFLASYTATPLTERVMRVTLSAPSSGQAVAGANAVARAFLAFRASEMQAEQRLVLASLDQQVSAAQQKLNTINAQISSTQDQSRLTSLRTQRTQAAGTLYNLQQAAIGNQTTVEPATAAAVKGSFLLDPATTLAHSRLKPLLRESAMGLVGGLAVGMAVVVIQELVSDRLRRRDDVAQAIGAPVKLSVPAVRGGLLKRSAGDPDLRRVAAYLGRAVPGSSRGVAALAVVPVDDPLIPARSLVSLATSLAEQGKQVVLADLCDGAPAARLLGGAEPGVRAARPHLVVAVPEPGTLAPDGPLPPDGPVAPDGRAGRRPADGSSSFTEAVASACAPAQILLSLATLDPALGGGHLATWASDAVVFVTAGRSSSTRIHATGEMIRLSGTRLDSVVLLGADASDESLGAN